MGRLTAKKDTVRNLFARSGNICAFPGCTAVLINSKGKFVGQICHIEAAVEGGERFNPKMTDEERRAELNLILLCYPHHIETNDVDEYTVEKMKDLKFEHEKVFGQKIYKIDESALYLIHEEMKSYWIKVEEHLTLRNMEREYSLELETQSTFFDVLNRLKGILLSFDDYHETWNDSDEKLPEDFFNTISKLGYDVSVAKNLLCHDNPFENRNWEMRNIGLHNMKTDLVINICHLEIKFLEEYLKTNQSDRKAKNRMEEVQLSLKSLVGTSGYVD